MNDPTSSSHWPDLLDPVELAVLKDRDFLPTKQRVSRKVEGWLTELGQRLQSEVQSAPQLPSLLQQSTPKLSRGENYHSYAYRVLDYPRWFEGEDMLTFRTLVLWGHPIGYHLMLAGGPRQRYLADLTAAIPRLPEGYTLSAQDHPWIWEAQADGLIPAQHISPQTCQQVLAERHFIKVSYFLDLDAHDQMIDTGLAVWRRWQGLFQAM
jgi:hypothetical protein